MKKEQFQAAEKLSVKMCYIIKKMSNQMPEGFLRLQVFLSANLAKPAMYLCVAVEAIFAGPFLCVTQSVNFG